MTDWCVVVGLHNWAMTKDAITDLLAQTGVQVRVLYIDQGSDDDTRMAARQWAEREPRLLVWTHDPCLPSLSATWNLALRFVWGQGGTHALVVNNDVRLAPNTYDELRAVPGHTNALFVSAVGVREADWDPEARYAVQYTPPPEMGWGDVVHKGGPDFSCYLITAGAHLLYPFDEGFSPAYCEDCSLHREFMLGGDGPRIFSVNLPYLHYASGTLKALSPEQRRAWEQRINGSRAYYARKWGGAPNHERFIRPFDETSARDGVTNPELQELVRRGVPVSAETLEVVESETLGDA